MIAAQTPIAVTGSTGRLGGRVARRLSEFGVEQRLLVRDPARAPDLPGSHIATADYSDRAALVAALSGIHTVFMVSASETPDRVQHHLTFIDAAVDAGVRRVGTSLSSAPLPQRRSRWLVTTGPPRSICVRSE